MKSVSPSNPNFVTFTVASPVPVHARRSSTSTPLSPMDGMWLSPKGWLEYEPPKPPSLRIAKMSRGSWGISQIRANLFPSAAMCTIGVSVSVPRAIPSDHMGAMPIKDPSRKGLSGRAGDSAMLPISTLGDTDPRNTPSRSK